MTKPSPSELDREFASQGGPASGDLVNYDDVLPPFTLMSTSGHLFALDGFSIARDMSKLLPRDSGASLRPLKALFKGAHPSRMTLVITPWDNSRFHFVVETGEGSGLRQIRIHEDSMSVAGKTLAEGSLPIIAARDLQQAAIAARGNGTALEVRLRNLQWRDKLPTKWREAAYKVLAENSSQSGAKAHALSEPLNALRAEQRKSVVGDFLGRCIWIDNRTEQLGYLAARRVWSSENDRFAFSPYPEGDSKMRKFADSLARNSTGRLVRRRDLARVISMVSSQLPWTSPTLEVCDQDFRATHGLQRYYSIYRGLDALSAIAAPLLVYEEGTLDSAIPLDLVQTPMPPEDYLFVSAPEIRERLRPTHADSESLGVTLDLTLDGTGDQTSDRTQTGV